MGKRRRQLRRRLKHYILVRHAMYEDVGEESARDLFNTFPIRRMWFADKDTYRRLNRD
jgi:hypothetical protein